MSDSVLRYRITLRAPALFPVGTGDPNSPATAAYIPGSTVAGALLSKWLAAPKTGDAGDEDFRRLFLDGRTRFLHAYPASPDGERMLPAPASLFEAKGAGSGDRLYDAALSDPDLDLRASSARLGFVSWKSPNSLGYYKPSVDADLHHVRERDLGRPKEGGLFFYQNIQAGEAFAGAILASSETDRCELEKLLRKGGLRLGRSRQTQYGADAEVEVLDGTGWSEATTAWEEESPEQLIVTLLSDYIGRSRTRGGYDPDALGEELARALNADSLRPAGRQFISYRVIHGYHSHARLHRTSAPAMRSGSVLRFERPAGYSKVIKGKVKVLGLGERQSEGYGRVALDWHGSYDADDIRGHERARYQAARSGEFPELEAVRMAMWEQWLRECLPIRASQLRIREDRQWPTPSAIGALRAALAQGWPGVSGDAEFLQWALKSIGQKARDALNSCPVEIAGVEDSRVSLLELMKKLQGTEGRSWVIEALTDSTLPKFLEKLPEPGRAELLARGFADALLEQARRASIREVE